MNIPILPRSNGVGLNALAALTKEMNKECPSCGELAIEDEQCKFCGYSLWTEGLTTEELNNAFKGAT